MSELPIIEYPDPRLQQVSGRVESFDVGTAQLVANLRDTLAATTGLGLSAPQVGVLLQVVIVASDAVDEAPEAFINPEIISRSGLAVCEESCLSLPGVTANVMRSAEIVVQAQDSCGKSFERRVEGMQAICLQHEVDHLAGKLFIDRISSLRRWRFRSTLAALRDRDTEREPATA